MKDSKFEFISYCVVGIILESIRRNGLEKTLEDLRKNCRLGPKGSELVYQDFLKVLNNISQVRELALQIKK